MPTNTANEDGLGALMERYMDGDEPAFVELHRRLAPKIRRQIRRKITDANAAEDLVQRVFLKAHRARERFSVGEGADADRAVSVWYGTIARNAVYDHLRRQYRARVSLVDGRAKASDDVIVAHPDPTPDSETLLLGRERERTVTEQVRGAVARLPDSQREVVALHRLQGMSMAEISRRLGVREGTLRVRAHRGYRALEGMLLGLTESLAGA